MQLYSDNEEDEGAVGYSSEEEDREMFYDEFLDKNIDFEKEIQTSKYNSMLMKRDKVEWSGQEIILDRDPWLLNKVLGELS
jgi:hypothetical protein